MEVVSFIHYSSVDLPIVWPHGKELYTTKIGHSYGSYESSNLNTSVPQNGTA